MATVPKNTRSTTINLAVSSAGPWALGFRLFDDDRVRVYLDGVETQAFSLTSTYANGYDDAATVTLDAPIAAPASIVIEAASVPYRAADLINGDKNLVQKLNEELARFVATLAELRRDVDRSVRGFTPLAPAVGIDLGALTEAEANAIAAAASAEEAAASAASALAAENSLLKNRRAWTTATAYAPSDIVQESGSSYVCIQAHTSGVFATDQGAGKWDIFASKGNSGAGTGDVIAANAGSEYTPNASAFRNAVSAAVRVNTVQSSKDLDADILDTTAYDLGSGNTNAPPGQADGDALWSRRRDGSVQNYIALLAGGQLYTRTRRGGTWSAWIAQATRGYVDAAIGSILHVRDAKASGTPAGGSTAGSYLSRTLNTVVTNTISGASLASNQITLPAGTYEFEAFVPGFGCGGFKAKLYNVTDGADVLIGSTAVAEATYLTADRSRIFGRFTLAATKSLDIRMRCNVSRASNGLGASLGYGDAEIFTEAAIKKIS